MREKDISVAVMYPGGRIDRLTKPLFATDMEVEVEPSNPYDYDIVMLDNADKYIFVPVIKSKFSDSKVIYRIRGDMLRAYLEMNNTTLKYRIAKEMIGRVDGAISIEPVLAERFERATGVNPIGFASLAKEIDAWPTVNHTDHSIRAITLTNAWYFDKVQPIIDYAPAVEKYFSENPGYWRIYGKGKYSKYLHDNLYSYDNIEYCGYTENPKEELQKSNVMFHLSRFDSMPNAILEGMACGMPVISNPYEVFSEYGYPLLIRNRQNLPHMLKQLQSPDKREYHGREAMKNIEQNHNPHAIGKQFVDFFKSIV